MELITIQRQLEEGIEWFEKNYEALAVAKAEYERLKDFQKTKLAVCELTEKVTGDTETTIKRKALACEGYQEFLIELDQVRVDYLKLNTQWGAKQAKFDGLRSLNKNIQ